jgi:hypothetical protein
MAEFNLIDEILSVPEAIPSIGQNEDKKHNPARKIFGITYSRTA